MTDLEQRQQTHDILVELTKDRSNNIQLQKFAEACMARDYMVERYMHPDSITPTENLILHINYKPKDWNYALCWDESNMEWVIKLHTCDEKLLPVDINGIA